MMCTSWLPDEVWTFLFRYLSPSDRLRVRATCKYFRDLVDNSDVWKDWTFNLKNCSAKYEEDFWALLRRWKVTSVRLSSRYSGKHITKELPGLTTLIINRRYFMDNGNLTDFLDFRKFSNLENLYITNLSCLACFEEISTILPQRLTHLTVCHQMVSTNTLPSEIPSDSPLKNLKSLAFHCRFDSHPVTVLHFFLSSFPQLQHLSLSIYTDRMYKGLISDLPPLHNCSLSSLELVKCELVNLPMDLMKMLKTTFLQSLNIFCLHDNINQANESLKLSAWLRDLPSLTSLVVNGADVSGFVGSIPSTVIRLTLMSPYIFAEDMTALSTQLPNLCHLHLEPYRGRLGSSVALIPQLFPRLRTLCLSCEQVPEDAFRNLASLKELANLEIQHLTTELVSKLQALTNHRVRMYTSPGKPWLRFCGCASCIRIRK